MSPAEAQPGGILLVVYSAVQTFGGGEKVDKELRSSGGNPPLIIGRFALCSSELLSLLMRASCDGNVGSYNDTGKKVDWPESTPVGMLSYAELETSIPVCDRLKSPAEAPVWIVHGGDHLTFAFAIEGDGGGNGAGQGGGALTGFRAGIAEEAAAAAAATAPSSSTTSTAAAAAAATGESNEEKTSKKLTLFHYNGLKPNGPRMAPISITLSAKTPVAAPAPEDHKEGVGVFRTPRVGEIFDIVQANQEQKKKGPKTAWKKWDYEVVLCVSDPDGKLYGKGESYPEGKGPPTFSQGDAKEGERWRCARCYVKRNETMAFRLNDADASTCQHCGKERSECGWSLWMPYDELPGGWKGSIDRRYQPKIISIIRTKWPGSTVDFLDFEEEGGMGESGGKGGGAEDVKVYSFPPSV